MSPRMLSIVRDGQYEQGEARQIPKLLEPGERVVEIGAGIGFISSLVGIQRKASRIAVYEANPALLPLIHSNHEMNGVVAEVTNAVIRPAVESGTTPFYVRHDFWASSLSPNPKGYREVVQVPAISFGEMLNKHRPTLLIVDIEGGELELFDGVSLTGVKKVYIELHQKVIGRVGMKRVFDFFSARDFHYDQHHSHGSVVLFSHVLR
jgi:FkbM family methyltransferase